MSKELTDIQDLKSAFVSHCRALGCEDDYIQVCENKFKKIEDALKRLEIENSKQFKEKLIQDNLAMTFELNVAKNKLKALDVIKYCICKDFELIDNASIDNCFKTSYRFRIYADDTYNEWYIDKEEYDLLKEVLL